MVIYLASDGKCFAKLRFIDVTDQLDMHTVQTRQIGTKKESNLRTVLPILRTDVPKKRQRTLRNIRKLLRYLLFEQ